MKYQVLTTQMTRPGKFPQFDFSLKCLDCSVDVLARQVVRGSCYLQVGPSVLGESDYNYLVLLHSVATQLSTSSLLSLQDVEVVGDWAGAARQSTCSQENYQEEVKSEA